MEILPPHLVETPVKSVKYHMVPNLDKGELHGAMLFPGPSEVEGLSCKVSRKFLFRSIKYDWVKSHFFKQDEFRQEPIRALQKYELWFDGFVSINSEDSGTHDTFQIIVSTELGKVKVLEKYILLQEEVYFPIRKINLFCQNICQMA